MKLDLGCGKEPFAGHIGVDFPDDSNGFDVPGVVRIGDGTHRTLVPRGPRIDERGIVRFDLSSGHPWPFEDESVEGLFSSHVIEHLPACRILCFDRDSSTEVPKGLPDDISLLKCVGTRDALLRFMDEAWRVTKPGGEFVLRWPALRNERTEEWQPAAFQDPTHYRFVDARQINYWSREGRRGLGVEQYRAICNWVPKKLEEGVIHFLQRELLPAKILENEVLLVKEP